MKPELTSQSNKYHQIKMIFNLILEVVSVKGVAEVIVQLVKLLTLSEIVTLKH